MKTIAFLSTLSLTMSAFAALPPYWDSVKKLTTALNSQQVAEALQGQPLQTVSLNHMTVTAQAGSCELQIRLLPILPQINGQPVIGPIEYTIESIQKQPTCLFK